MVQSPWVPYRLEDGSVDWSWSWDPSLVIAEWDRKVFEQIRKEWRKEQNGKKEDAQTDRLLTPSPSIPASRARRIRSLWGEAITRIRLAWSQPPTQRFYFALVSALRVVCPHAAVKAAATQSQRGDLTNRSILSRRGSDGCAMPKTTSVRIQDHFAELTERRGHFYRWTTNRQHDLPIGRKRITSH